MARRHSATQSNGPVVPAPGVGKVCALDLGSKTFKAVIGELRDGLVSTRLLDKRVVRLGAEVEGKGGVLGPSKLDEARRALSELKALCHRAGSDTILAVATRAARKAVNGDDLVRAAREVGIDVQVANGEREGELAYLAVTAGAPGKLVCDFGSQSMQLAWQTRGRIESYSLDIGYERAYAEFFRDARTFRQAREAYLTFLAPRLAATPSAVDELICLAMNTMAAFVVGKPKSEITDRPLRGPVLRKKLDELNRKPAGDFHALVSRTPKSEKIFPELVLVEQLLDLTGLDSALIARAELPVGLIVEYFERLRDAR